MRRSVAGALLASGAGEWTGKGTISSREPRCADARCAGTPRAGRSSTAPSSSRSTRSGWCAGSWSPAFSRTSDYGVWGVLSIALAGLFWFKQVGVGDKYVQQDEPDQELAFQKAFTLEAA